MTEAFQKMKDEHQRSEEEIKNKMAENLRRKEEIQAIEKDIRALQAEVGDCLK